MQKNTLLPLIKIIQKMSISHEYFIMYVLQKNEKMYSDIILMSIINIIESENNKNKNNTIWDKIKIFYNTTIENNKFYDTTILKHALLSRLKKIESINKNFIAANYESMLYMLAFFIKDNPKKVLNIIMDKDFLKFMFLCSSLKGEDIIFLEKIEDAEDKRKLEKK